MKNPFKVKLKRAGQFYWKPVFCSHRQNVTTWKWIGRLECSDQRFGKDIYETKFGWHIESLQIFFLWWYLDIDTSLRFNDGMGRTATHVEYSPLPPNEKYKGTPFDENLANHN